MPPFCRAKEAGAPQRGTGSGCRKSPTDFFDAFTIPRFSGRSAARKSAAARRKRLLAQAFCRHLIPHEGAPAPSYSPCKMQPSCFKQWFFDKLSRCPAKGHRLQTVVSRRAFPPPSDPRYIRPEPSAHRRSAGSDCPCRPGPRWGRSSSPGPPAPHSSTCDALPWRCR